MAALWLTPLSAQPLGVPVVALTPEQAIQEGLRRQEERSRDQQRAVQPKADELKTDPGRVGRSAFAREAQCFVINELSIGGKDAARFGWLRHEALPYLDQCVGVKALSAIAAELDPWATPPPASACPRRTCRAGTFWSM
ncbi:MAG: hypothetical protein ABI606_05275 [Rhodoferax sp.]